MHDGRRWAVPAAAAALAATGVASMVAPVHGRTLLVLTLAFIALFVWLYVRDEALRRLQAHARLERERQVRLALDAGRMGWWSWAPATGRLQWSPEMGPLYGQPLGWSPPDGTGLSVVHPDDVDRVAYAFAAVQRDGGGHVLPYRVVWPDGTIRWLDAEVRLERETSGVRVTGVVRDVTEAEVMREAYEDTAYRLRAILDATTNGLVLREGEELRPTLINPAALEMLGIPPEEVDAYRTGEKRWVPLDEMGIPLPLERTPAAMALRSGQEAIGTYQVQRPDGSRVWITATAVPFQQASSHDAVLMSLADVTHVRDLEEQLRLMSEVAEHTNDGVNITDAEGRTLWINAAFARMTGFTLEEVRGRSPLEYLRADAASADREATAPLRGALANGGSFTGAVDRFAKDGAPLQADLSVSPIRNNSHGARGFIAIARDASERLRTERRLQESEQRYRELVEASRDIVVRLDAAYRVVYASPRIEEVLGWTPDEVTGRPLSDLMTPDDAKRAQAMRAEVAVAQDLGLSTYRAAVRHKNGDLVWIESSPAVQRSATGEVRGAVITLRDVTARQNLEAQVQQAARMEAVGLIAAGVAHDFNNLLTIVGQHAELLAQRESATFEELGDTDVIAAAVQRGRALTGQLLTFTKQNVEQVEQLPVDTLITQSVGLLRGTVRPGQQLEIRTDAAGTSIRADRSELELALVNLVANARDASRSNGVITISTRRVDERDDTRPPELIAGPYAVIEVIDEGTGFTEDAKAHLFEPFFTTKEAGAGTGLGLVTIKRVLQKAAGTVTVQSQPGQGTVVALWLPAIAADLEITTAAHRPPVLEPPGDGEGRATVLIVDDEPAVRHATARLITKGGFRVVTASSAPEALAMLALDTPRIDIVVTDFAMPGMTGADLLRQAAKRGLARPAILMSGFTADEDLRHDVEQIGAQFLPKPFSSAELHGMLMQLVT